MSPADLLRAYDEQLREEAEVPSAVSVTRLGPLTLATFRHGRGFITYRDLATEQPLPSLVEAALAHFAQDPEIREVEWKTRGHDHAPGLHEALLGAGFVAEEPESIMIGEARLLALDLPLPGGVTIRRVSEEADVRRTVLMQTEVFGDSPQDAVEMADRLLVHLREGDGVELWAAEHRHDDGSVETVSAGRLQPVADTAFAGLWGGSTRPEWRGRGIYRALTAARARSALAMGKRYLNSDSTEFSRPILERSGLVKVSTTTPYTWSRGRDR